MLVAPSVPFVNVAICSKRPVVSTRMDQCTNMRYVRTLDEIRTLIEHAKLNEKDIKSETQVINFSPDVNDHNKMLLELDNGLLEYVTKGNSLIIRGDNDDHAVICTEDATYAIKEAETSNCMLLFKDISEPGDIVETDERQITSHEVMGMFHTYLELTPCRPKLQKLRLLLDDNPYQGKENEKENPFTNFTFEDLLDKVQASERELAIGLRQIEAFEIDGHWRLLEFDYKWRVLMHILNFIEENSWNYASIPKQLTLATLEDLEPRSILDQCLDYYAAPCKRQNDDGQDLYRINEGKVCRFFAEVMLRQTGRFNLQEFLEAWELSVPIGMTTSIQQLEGLALIDQNSFPQTISYFPIWKLPEEIGERFNFLFQTRSKWSFEDICHFIKDLTTDKVDVNGLLTKYARASTQNGVRYYTPKRPIT